MEIEKKRFIRNFIISHPIGKSSLNGKYGWQTWGDGLNLYACKYNAKKEAILDRYDKHAEIDGLCKHCSEFIEKEMQE